MEGIVTQNEKGFTYIEVLVSIVIIALMILPIYSTWSNMNKMWVNSVRINESAAYGEALMEEVKRQLTRDIKLKRQKEMGVLEENPKKEAKGIKYCLEMEYSKAHPLTSWPLEDFLTVLSTSQFETLYHTKQYAYEVAIWRSDNLDLEKMSVLSYTPKDLERAAKWYSFEGDTFEKSDVHLVLKLTADIKNILKCEKETWPEVEAYTLILHKEDLEKNNLKKIKLKSTQSGEQEPIIIKGIEDNKGLTYKITTNETKTLNGINVINVDISSLLKSESGLLEVGKEQEDFTLKFINQTKQNQVLRIICNQQTLKNALKEVARQINIIAVDESLGKTSIQYLDKHLNGTGEYENFIIAIVIRDKQPVWGKKGKIVKKMIDLYSYDSNND